MKPGRGRQALIKEALNYFNSQGQGHDFSQYDYDQDGDIDYFAVFWTGPDTGWGNFWWAYKDDLAGFVLHPGWEKPWGFTRGSGSRVVPVLSSTRPGTPLGLPRLLRLRRGCGSGRRCRRIRHDGCQPGRPQLLQQVAARLGGTCRHRLYRRCGDARGIPRQRIACWVWPGIGLEDMFSEFFMVQNRQDTGNDESFDFAPDGLAIWHIDATLKQDGSYFTYNNSYSEHKLIRLMEADGLEEIENNLDADWRDPV